MGTLAEQLARVFPSHIKSSNSLQSLYPLTLKQGDIGAFHPSRKPSSLIVNSFHVSERARTFGVWSRI